MTALAVLDRMLSIEQREDVDALLDDVQRQKLATIAGELELYQNQPCLKVVPADAAACHEVADVIKGCAASVAELERSRKARTGPLNDQVSRINALYKRLTDQLLALRAQADKLVLAHNQAERARKQRELEEQQRRQAEAAQAEAEAVARAQAAKTETERMAAMAQAETASREIAAAQVAEPAPAPRAYRNDTGTVSIRKTWVLAGFDPEKIPAEYYRHEKVLEVVRKLLEAQVRAGARHIPGTVIEEKEGTSARA